MHRHLIPKLVGAVVLLVALGGGAASAFTATNTAPVSYAGSGGNTISGYQVNNIHYTLAPSVSMPGTAKIVGVSFSLDKQATTVGYVFYDGANAVGGGGGGNGNGTCVETANTYDWTCTGGSAPEVQEVTWLNVIAAH